MKIQLPKPFHFECEGETAVILLHGFTGNSSDVRQLGRYLQKKGITSIGPHYEGHGEVPEALLKSSPHVWYKQVLNVYDDLKDEGYTNIYVAGVSLGGVLSLRLSMDRNIKGVIPICAPMKTNNDERLFDMVLTYARNFKSREGKSEEQIAKELKSFHPTDMIRELQEVVQYTIDHLEDVFSPTFIAQGSKDEVIDLNSPQIIQERISTDDDEKTVKWYENSGHVLTIDNDKEELFEDIYLFITQ